MRALLLLLLLSPAASAQQDLPPPAPALPPPQIDDEGVETVAENQPAATENGEEPTITTRTGENGDRIEEMRLNGRITMVKVTPRRGKPYYFVDTNGDGKIDRTDSDSNVAPVYFKLYEWE